jgi:hypothetical protein
LRAPQLTENTRRCAWLGGRCPISVLSITRARRVISARVAGSSRPTTSRAPRSSTSEKSRGRTLPLQSYLSLTPSMRSPPR